MKSLSQHVQETLNNESLKEAFEEKFVDEELDALTRVSPATKVEKKDGKSLEDIAIGG